MAGVSFKIPNWTGKPPPGLHLDVMKDDKLMQKVMVDGKNAYYFGRNSQTTDICIEHPSSSRVHAVLLHHKQLERAFLVDLGSTHGTFIGSIRLEAYKPTQLLVDTPFRFGASTRTFLMRERPSDDSCVEGDEDVGIHEGKGTLLGLPASGTGLQLLTEFNTANNRRVSLLGIPNDEKESVTKTRPDSDDHDTKKGKKRKRGDSTKKVSFSEEVSIINLEEVDPSVGKFRNLVKSTVIPSTNKRPKSSLSGLIPPTINIERVPIYPDFSKWNSRYDNHELLSYSKSSEAHQKTSYFSYGGLQLSLLMPNSAPEEEEQRQGNNGGKKIYVKEAWPGKGTAVSIPSPF